MQRQIMTIETSIPSEQLKIEDSKLRDFINISTLELETQIQLILGWSKLLLGDDVGSSQQLPTHDNEFISTNFLVYS